PTRKRPGHTRRFATVASFRTWRGSRPHVVPTTNFRRRERDSNPRYPFEYTRVPGVRLQPLGHLSQDIYSGERRVRTYGTVTGTPDFESGAFDHSASSPWLGLSSLLYPQSAKEVLQQLAAFVGEQPARDLDAVIVPLVLEQVVQRAGGAHLWIPGGVNQASKTALDHRTRAHRARFERHVERDAGKPPGTKRGRGFGHPDELGASQPS